MRLERLGFCRQQRYGLRTEFPESIKDIRVHIGGRDSCYAYMRYKFPPAAVHAV